MRGDASGPPPEPPEPARWPVCPVCGAEAESIYLDDWDRPAGCGSCLRREDAWDCAAAGLICGM